jgi:hypothetical protein
MLAMPNSCRKIIKQKDQPTSKKSAKLLRDYEKTLARTTRLPI